MEDSKKKRNNFKRISSKRVQKACDAIVSLKALNNRYYYEYDNEDVEDIINTLSEEIDALKRVLMTGRDFTLDEE